MQFKLWVMHIKLRMIYLKFRKTILLQFQKLNLKTNLGHNQKTMFIIM